MFDLHATREDGSLADLLETSGRFSDATCGVVGRTTQLMPSERDYAIVPRTPFPNEAPDLELLIYADQPITLSERR